MGDALYDLALLYHCEGSDYLGQNLHIASTIVSF